MSAASTSTNLVYMLTLVALTENLGEVESAFDGLTPCFSLKREPRFSRFRHGRQLEEVPSDDDLLLRKLSARTVICASHLNAAEGQILLLVKNSTKFAEFIEEVRFHHGY
jgi:hypothetical protein